MCVCFKVSGMPHSVWLYGKISASTVWICAGLHWLGYTLFLNPLIYNFYLTNQFPLLYLELNSRLERNSIFNWCNQTIPCCRVFISITFLPALKVKIIVCCLSSAYIHLLIHECCIKYSNPLSAKSCKSLLTSWLLKNLPSHIQFDFLVSIYLYCSFVYQQSKKIFF